MHDFPRVTKKVTSVPLHKLHKALFPRGTCEARMSTKIAWKQPYLVFQEQPDSSFRFERSAIHIMVLAVPQSISVAHLKETDFSHVGDMLLEQPFLHLQMLDPQVAPRVLNAKGCPSTIDGAIYETATQFMDDHVFVNGDAIMLSYGPIHFRAAHHVMTYVLDVPLQCAKIADFRRLLEHRRAIALKQVANSCFLVKNHSGVAIYTFVSRRFRKSLLSQ